MPINFGSIKGAEPSTVTFKARTITQTVNSTVMHSEVIALGDPQSSIGIAVVKAAAPVSTEFGLVVRLAGGPSSAVDCTIKAVLSSTSADNPVTISGNSTVVQGTNPWTIAGNSTVVIVSGNSSVIITSGNSSVIITSGNLTSTCVQGTNPWTVAGNCTAFQGGSPWVVSQSMQSSLAPSSGSSGVIVRQVIDNILTTASTNAMAGSTALSIQTSGAALRSYVTAYSILSTNAGPVKLAFYSGATMTWPLTFAAVSSAVSGANLAVGAPAYLFRTAAADALTLNIKGSTLAGFQVAVSYFRAP